MSGSTVESWSPALRVEVGEPLARHLRARAAEGDALARTLAPDGPGPGVRYAEHTTSIVSPARLVAYQARFAGIEELLVLAEAGDPGALVFGLELLARLDPEATVPLAMRLVTVRPWNGLGAALGHALGRCSSERSFRLLVDHPDVPYLRDGLATNGYAAGVAEAWSLVRSVDLLAADLDPRRRVEVLPALSYLLRHDPDAAYPELVRALDGSHEVEVFAAHALSRIDPAGREVLLARLHATAAGAPLSFASGLAVRLLLETAPERAVDALGGEAFLASVGGRPRLVVLIQWLSRDALSRGHEASRGWLRADRRFASLLEGLRGSTERELAARARDLLATLPERARPAPARRGATARTIVAPDPALLREVELLRDRLARLVAHLRATHYRFVEPRRALAPPRVLDAKALARLEKKVSVPAALGALWRVVGSVDLRGTDPSWARPGYVGFPGAAEPVWETDPLVIAPAAAVIAEALDEHTSEPFALHLAPDATGKAGYSGGALTVWLPQAESDPTLEGTGETLLAHLRRALAWGGMPGLATIEARPEPWLAAARAASR